ncbi:biotin transporter BioY [Amylibacter sp. SFDW26]|nr:biotin transporter BioY [Amylibacter sp. SFDW26]
MFVAKILVSVCLLTASAKLAVPFWPVPMTMQVGAVLLIAGLGGLRFGTLSILSYMAVGAAGLPVFSGTPEKGIGLAYIVGPTGGYLLGFFVAAALVGWVTDHYGRAFSALAMCIGLLCIYGFGLAWLAAFVPAHKVIAYGLAPFWMGDLFKLVLAALVTFIMPAKVVAWIKGTH